MSVILPSISAGASSRNAPLLHEIYAATSEAYPKCSWADHLWTHSVSWRGRPLVVLKLHQRLPGLDAERSLVFALAHCRNLTEVYDKLHSYRHHPQRRALWSELLGLSLHSQLVTKTCAQLLSSSGQAALSRFQ